MTGTANPDRRSRERGTTASHDMPDSASRPKRLRRLPTRLLNMNAVRADRLTTERLAAVGAHRWHYAVLSSLEESGPGSQAELSRRTGIYRSDMVAVVNELSDGGFVERAPDPDDRRRNTILLTDAGSGRIEELAGILQGVEDELLAPFSPAERELLINLLIRLDDHLGQD